MINSFFKRLYSNTIATQPGKSYPLGATTYKNGVNFCIYSKHATAVELLLFESKNHIKPKYVISLDPEENHTSFYWHVFVPDIGHGQVYGYRIKGPFDPRSGLRFDGAKTLLDPYAKAVVMDRYDRSLATMPGDNCASATRGVVIDNQIYDWEGDQPLNIPLSKSVIYELHVGGFTKNPNSGLPEHLRGTYLGLIEKIPYLKDLGITAVELLPIHQFDPFDLPDASLTNYWGYSPIAYFAVHHGYGTTKDPLKTLDEFRDMVKALHQAGIEVILDVVFNHTAEGNQSGPTLSMKGIENKVYYILEEDQRYYKNFSGTGNTLKANHSVVRRMIIDCLRYWVTEMHVDGFRFDLASVLSRDEQGNPIKDSPILWEIESDPILSHSKIIAEAWDLGQYQLGSFIGDRWAEWNGKFRDDIRDFVKGNENMMRVMVQRLTGSPDLFRNLTRDPSRSINFITCHDGFTMNDLVSYNQKHNFANGENNRDGHNDNHSWNHGVEGATDDPKIEALRWKQIKNLFTILFFAQGTPMISMGDEVRRTQLGNNNAYCQDNEISWFDWSLVEKHQDLYQFVKQLIRFHLGTEFFQERCFWNLPDELKTNFELHGVKLGQISWERNAHAFAFTLYNPDYDKALHVMINAYWEPLTFEIPELTTEKWRLLINTANPSPDDFYSIKKDPVIHENTYKVSNRSIVVLFVYLGV